MGIVSDAVASLPAPSVQGAMIVHPAPMRLEGSGRGGGQGPCDNHLASHCQPVSRVERTDEDPRLVASEQVTKPAAPEELWIYIQLSYRMLIFFLL